MFSCRVHLTEDPNECIDLHVEEEIRLNKKEVKAMTGEQIHDIVVKALLNGPFAANLTGYQIRKMAEDIAALVEEDSTEVKKEDNKCNSALGDLKCELYSDHDGDCVFV